MYRGVENTTLATMGYMLHAMVPHIITKPAMVTRAVMGTVMTDATGSETTAVTASVRAEVVFTKERATSDIIGAIHERLS